MENKIDKMIGAILEHCKNWLSKDEYGNDVIIDPIDNKVIGAHYALSHYSVAMCILGYKENSTEIESVGIDLLQGLINRWDIDSRCSDFHNDFNNFALCVLAQFWEEQSHNINTNLYNQMKDIVMKTDDSRHDTVNWIPMRIFVNKKRLEWTGNKKYKSTILSLKKRIQSAINEDGYIEDRLPKGVSYNLQYNVATLSLLAFLNKYGEDYDLGQPLYSLINAIDPTGDINYLGRGCNQIFCWGPWLYLLKVANKTEIYEEAISYLFNHLQDMLKNDNILLNKFSGTEKYMWWDYHYVSVYISHLLFWLILTRYENHKQEIPENYSNEKNSSGITIIKNDRYFAVKFDGRREYLAEKGPNLVNLWTNRRGTVFKGSFGPWMGMFGSKYISNTSVLRNYLGPICVKQTLKSNQIIHMFPDISIKDFEDYVIVNFTMKKKKNSIFNLPIFKEASSAINDIKVFADNKEVKLVTCGTIKNQYDELTLYQSTVHLAKVWSLKILVCGRD